MFKVNNRAETFYANLHIAGCYEDAVKEARRFAYNKGYCVQVHKCDYIYTGGMENGLLIRVIQYPRFYKEVTQIKEDFIAFSHSMGEVLYQKSFTVEFPDDTLYFQSDNELHNK